MKIRTWIGHAANREQMAPIAEPSRTCAAPQRICGECLIYRTIKKRDVIGRQRPATNERAPVLITRLSARQKTVIVFRSEQNAANTREQQCSTNRRCSDIRGGSGSRSETRSRSLTSRCWSLLHPDSHWRDVLALTWKIRTVNGRDAILSGLQSA